MSGEVTARLPSGKRVRLPAQAFVAAGGEGSIYARGDVAYKIYDDPARAIAAGKIAELARIAHPAVLTPRELLHSEDGGAPIGSRYLCVCTIAIDAGATKAKTPTATAATATPR